MQKLLILLTLTLTMVLAGIQVYAEETPLTLPGVKIVDAATVKNMLDAGKTMTLFDARKTPDFEAGHLPTAESYPVPGDLDISDDAIKRSVAALEAIPALMKLDKNSLIITYCNGTA